MHGPQTTTDGVAHEFNRRERPHLLFDDATGTRPVVLYTTLTNWCDSGSNNGKDKAFTFAQRIGSAQGLGTGREGHGK